MTYTVEELRSSDFWPPDSIGFLPFVGERYDKGVDGARVLLLGESHYIPNGEATRDYTRRMFDGCDSEQCAEVRKKWGTFFWRLDEIITRRVSPSDTVASDAWKHIAFANFVQSSVGDSAAARPGKEGWKSGRQAFPVLLEKLQPSVILVLGRTTFRRTPDRDGQRIGEIRVSFSAVPRDLWELTHPSGKALMSWVYHPSWNMDTQKTRIAVFDELIRQL